MAHFQPKSTAWSNSGKFWMPLSNDFRVPHFEMEATEKHKGKTQYGSLDWNDRWTSGDGDPCDPFCDSSPEVLKAKLALRLGKSPEVVFATHHQLQAPRRRSAAYK
jgi:hypothetical protein